MKKLLLTLIGSMLLTAMPVPVIAANTDYNNFKEGILIDKALPEKDKEKIKEVMLKLDKGHRENVVHINEDGSVISNKKELLDEFKKINKDKLDNDGRLKLKPKDWVYQDTQTQVSEKALPASVLSSTGWKNPDYESENANSGPYRRVLTGNGYSRLVTDVWVPKKSDGGIYMKSGTNDKAYVYTGAIDKNGKAIDIGLAYNYESGPYAWNESWGMFVKGAKDETITMPNIANFQGGQFVVMDFYVAATNYVALFCSGYNNAGVYGGGTLTAELGSSYSFYADGTGMKLKRITSIAQDPQNLSSGSELKYVHWTNVRIGQRYNPSESQDWGLFYGYKRTNVLVDYTSQNEEKVWIKCGTLTP